MFDGQTLGFLATPLACALCAFVAIWPISVLRRDASLVDLAWAPGFLMQFAVAAALVPALSVAGWVLIALIGTWSLRLTATLTRRRFVEGHEDARYTLLRESWDPGFWWKSLFVVFVLQAFVQWFVILGPMSTLLQEEQPLSALSVLGALAALSGLAVETIADTQLDRFKSRKQGATTLLTTGLRAHVRHPNYSGEILFWVGIALICIDAGSWAGIAAPALIAALLAYVSGIPLLDERLLATRPDYAAYRARVPAFVPAIRSLRSASTDQ